MSDSNTCKVCGHNGRDVKMYGTVYLCRNLDACRRRRINKLSKKRKSK